MKFKKGDSVIVTTGKYKGQQGQIIQVVPTTRHVVIEGINMVKRRVKPSMNKNTSSAMVERPLHSSNVLHVDPRTGLPTRIGYKTLPDGNKIRFAKRTGEHLDVVK